MGPVILVQRAVLISEVAYSIETDGLVSVESVLNIIDILNSRVSVTLLKMGRYYNTTMCHYWDMLVK